MSTVTLRIDNQVAWITLNRPEKRNALTQGMWQELVNCIECIEQEVPVLEADLQKSHVGNAQKNNVKKNNVKVLILTANGDKAFSGGADIEELTDIISDKQRLIDNNKLVQQAQLKLQQLSIPTIAAINGVCVGGGMGLALACDFRVCVDHAKFGITPAKLGLLYSLEDTRRLVNIVGLARAKELLFLGKIITAKQAKQWGVVNECVGQMEFISTVEKMAEQLLHVSRTSIAGIKATLDYVTGSDSSQEHAIRDLFDHAFSQPDFSEGASAFLEKRTPEFK